jgi:ABC-type Na+ transport system ATPase subunit NatA
MSSEGRWRKIELNDEEVDKALDELIEKNFILLKLCMKKASELDLKLDNRIELAIALFNSSAIANYTMLCSKVDSVAEDKIKEMKERTKSAEFQRAKEIEKKLGETVNVGKSAIDKVFGSQ